MRSFVLSPGYDDIVIRYKPSFSYYVKIIGVCAFLLIGAVIKLSEFVPTVDVHTWWLVYGISLILIIGLVTLYGKKKTQEIAFAFGGKGVMIHGRGVFQTKKVRSVDWLSIADVNVTHQESSLISYSWSLIKHEVSPLISNALVIKVKTNKKLLNTPIEFPLTLISQSQIQNLDLNTLCIQMKEYHSKVTGETPKN